MKSRKKKVRKPTTTLRKVISAAKQGMIRVKKNRTITTLAKGALLAAKKEVRGKQVLGKPRTLNVPNLHGGFLQTIIPILSGLSALGTIVGGVSGIANAVKDFKNARNSNQITPITSGSGLYIKPYREGFGITTSKN